MARAGRMLAAALALVVTASLAYLQAECRLWRPDQCHSGRALRLPVEQLDAVIVEVESIEDPVLRGATLLSWADLHRGELPMDRTERICAVLSVEEALWCRRHLGSSHLAR